MGAPERLDKVVAALTGCSRGEARRLAEAGGVFVDGVRLRRLSALVPEGARVEVHGGATAIEARAERREAEGEGPRVLLDGPVAILWKPAGMPVEPTRQARAGTLLAWVEDVLGAKEAAFHQRLDREAQGLLPVVLDPRWNGRFARALREGRVGRRYRAWVEGAPGAGQGRWAHLQERHGERRRALPTDLGDDALVARPDGMLSHYRVERVGADGALLTVELRTGRTHQIRLQAAAEGLPVRGDLRYGRPDPAGLHLVASYCSVDLGRDGRADLDVPAELLPPWARAS